ncbi:MAG TPA: SDR family oxidoreductase [Thermoleophilia bacterium]|nr:SDR family oxidoreductase [Thermoleophilia bacterium]
MSNDLAGRSVLVTGASIGIGRETAFRFAAAGCRVALTYFEHRAEAEAAAQRCLGLGAPDAFAISLQLSDVGDECRVVEAVVERFGGLDLLINNAGVISWKPFLEQDFGEIDEQILVNLLGVMKLTWCALPHVHDAVITVGSTATLHQSHTPPPYCAGKWGLRGFVKALALEHPGKRIVSVHPTVTATRMNDMRGMPPERVADVIVRVAAGEIEVEPGGDVDLRDFAEGFTPQS